MDVKNHNNPRALAFADRLETEGWDRETALKYARLRFGRGTC